jgi:hypothetical protein
VAIEAWAWAGPNLSDAALACSIRLAAGGRSGRHRSLAEAFGAGEVNVKKALAFGSHISALIAILVAAYAFFTGDRAILKLTALLCMLYVGSEFHAKTRTYLEGSTTSLARAAGWANELFYWIVLLGTIALFVAFARGSFA